MEVQVCLLHVVQNDAGVDDFSQVWAVWEAWVEWV